MSAEGDVKLVTANPAEIEQSLAYNSSLWRGPLSREAYFRREADLADEDLTRDGGLRSWILVPETNASSATREILCSCETIRKRALITVAGEGVRETVCYGVASVFTPLQHRGKGYASEMLRQLGAWVDQEGKGKGGFSILYSDIGKDFYAKLGWRPMESSHLSVKPIQEGTPFDGVKYLGFHDLDEYCAKDEVSINLSLHKLASQGRSAVAICPDARTLRWVFAREAFVRKELHEGLPDNWGAVVKLPGGKEVWCWWTRWRYNDKPTETKGNSMHVLRLATDAVPVDEVDSGVQAATAKLLDAARQEASKWYMAEVQVWNPSPTTLAAARALEPDVELRHREKDSIASLRWCDDTIKASEPLAWIANQKFAWC